MRPYFEAPGLTVYHDDCLDILPHVAADTIITDPVWPDATVPLAGWDDPQGLLAAALDASPDSVQRVAVQVGVDTDPRFLTAVPARWPFFRSVLLEVSVPSRKGRLLGNGDAAYLFGAPPLSRPGYHLIGGYHRSSDANGKQRDHPTPRKIDHVEWLVSRWSAPDDVILDPFAGSGTTGLAALRWQRECILVECEERHCETIAREAEKLLSTPRLPMSYT